MGRRIDNLVTRVDLAQENEIEALDAPAVEQANALDNGNIAARFAQNGLDANALLNGLAQGQGQRSGSGDISTNDVAGDLANQVAGGGSTSIGDILTGLNGQKQSPSTNQTSIPQAQGQSPTPGQNPTQGTPQSSSQGTGSDVNSSNVAGDLANQLAPKPASGESSVNDVAGDLANQFAPNGQGQLPPSNGQGQLPPNGPGQLPSPNQVGAQQNGSNFQTIQIAQTVITEPNGQQISTALVEAALKGAAEPTLPAAGEVPAAVLSSASAVLSSAPAEAPASSPSAAEETPAPAQGETPAALSSSAEKPSAESSSSSQAVRTVFPAGKSALPAVTPVPWPNPPSQMGGMAAGNSSTTNAMAAAMPAAEPTPAATLAEGKNSTVR